jgi:hypothetical protein
VLTSNQVLWIKFQVFYRITYSPPSRCSQCIRPGCRTTRAAVPLIVPPCVPSRADPSGLGHTATIYSSVQGPPGVETPTKVFDKNEKFAGKWIRELTYVVWSLRTQPSRALHGNTPFFMVYGSEAVLPADLKFGAPG